MSANSVSPQYLGECIQDPWPGYITRSQFFEDANQSLCRSQKAGRPRALLLLDIDGFRRTSSCVGTDIAAQILCRAAKRIAVAMGPDVILGRVGDDEFAMLLTQALDGMAEANRLLDIIARPFAVHGQVITIGASIGVAMWPADGSTSNDLLCAASMALEKIKKGSCGKALAFSPAMAADAQTHRVLGADLRSALALERTRLRSAVLVEQFTLFYQPQVATSDGRLTGFEALLRWNHPQRGLLAPGQFIALAEEVGVIGMLGDWALLEACRAAVKWPLPANGRPLTVAVNVSPRQLENGPALIAGITRALAISGIDPARLHVEIVETALLGDVASVLCGIKSLGVHLAMDDFGSGFSSLGNLVRFPFDTIKMDRSFILALSSGDPKVEAASARMIRGIAALALSLGLTVVAEGIETSAQAALMGAAGITTLQGYYLSRPVPGSAVPDMIARGDEAHRQAS